jgi:hypothetical protein
MKMPWTRRTQERTVEAERRAAAARRDLQQVREQWPMAIETASESRHHRQLNGWTDTIKTIFGGNR